MQLRHMISAMSLAFSAVNCILLVLIKLPKRTCMKTHAGMDKLSKNLMCSCIPKYSC